MSASKYSTIPAEDSEDGGFQSLELEDMYIIRQYPSKRVPFVVVAISLFALVVVVVGYSAHAKIGNRESTHAVSISNEVPMPKIISISEPDIEESTQEQKINQHVDESLVVSADMKHIEPIASGIPPRIIFSYGDSLTYGMLPHSKESCPYSQYLEQELNTLLNSSSATLGPKSESQTKAPATIVEYLGLPGFTASKMLYRIHAPHMGVCSILQRCPTISLMIIMIGTNDIGVMANADKDAARSIVESIVNLHKAAFSCAEDEGNNKLHTLAVGIPGSAYQEKVPIASEYASYINEAMKEFAAESSNKISYVDFPFPFQEADQRWGEDGLHLTCKGYERLGKDLAPFVKVILERDDLV